MKNKLVFVSGVAVGYVLGTQAGRDSYEKLKTKVRGFRQGPTARDEVSDAAGAIRNKAPEVRGQASQAVKKEKEEITGTLHHDATPHKDGTTSGTPQHDHAKADTSQSTFYGMGGPASHESPDAETARRQHQKTGSQDRTD